MGVGGVLLVNGAVVTGLMLVVWLLSLKLRDASIVDIAWGPAFAVVAWVTFSLADGDDTRRVLLAVLPTLWGVRLGAYLAMRANGRGEDFRYRAMRRKHGSRFPLVSLATVFGIQGVLIWTVSLPVQVAQTGVDAIGVLDYLGVGGWAIGMFFEAVGDGQLSRFRADPSNEGKVMDRGLWRYTRHPNYFGDFMVWWGVYLIALSAGGAWWTILGPIVMTTLLTRVSGKALLEKSLRKRREGYEEYARRTSGFFPRPPKRA